MAVVNTRVEELDFRPPGPGSWERERTHMPYRMSRHAAEVLADAFWAGFTDSAARYGLLLEGIRMEVVNGWMYASLRPVGPDQFAARIEQAARAFAERQWRADLARWDEQDKPATLARHAELVAVDPASLDDEALIAYLADCAAHHAAMITQHHVFTASCVIPVGELLANTAEWTGMTPNDLLGLLSGLSPASSGDCPELGALVDALDADPGARALLQDSDLEPGLVLDQLAAAADPVGSATRAWLDIAGHRLVDGFDVWFPTALEQPGHLVDTVRRALGRPPAPDPTAAVAAVRQLVPEEHRAEFDQIYADVGAVYRLRDERGLYSDLLAAGVMRRAMIGAGRKLAERGLLDSPGLAVEASRHELASLLRTGEGPSSAELSVRAASHLDDTGVPEHLGDPPSPPPPLEMLPPPAARAMRAMMTAMGLLFATAEADDPSVLRGIPGSPGFHAGKARVIRSPEDLSRLRSGDVLVTTCTSAAFNVALAEAGAVVTDHGGPLSHAAITAREFGIPSVVGTVHATARITDGDSVAVDGNTGEVTIL
ncbi:MAG TPA: PEP-utilizing enzyme [Acidimicrobiales bacterium]|nr:PEP-utilizing enzyme [Acidimicrobiales bacterium]